MSWGGGGATLTYAEDLLESSIVEIIDMPTET